MTENYYVVDASGYEIRTPKQIARVKLCGGGLTFIFDETMQFEMPTEEQRENLKKVFGIEIESIRSEKYEG